MRLFTFVFSLIAIVLLTASAADAIAIDPKAACGSEGDNNKDYTEGHECKYLVTDLEPHPHLVTYAGNVVFRFAQNVKDFNRLRSLSDRLERPQREREKSFEKIRSYDDLIRYYMSVEEGDTVSKLSATAQELRQGLDSNMKFFSLFIATTRTSAYCAESELEG
ncbi:hypothetical protein EV360DRAFT_70915 [Lentinula raphanica]|nr:hypothetical protein EV360DRAFT_70915 [Lentinula raphanica]